MATNYGNGFVFTQQPNWDGIERIKCACKCVAFQHDSELVWFACIADPKTLKRSRDLHPLSIPPPNEIRANSSECQAKTVQILEVLDAVAAVLDSRFVASGVARIHACLEVANVTESPVFYLEADDEFVDRACYASPGQIKAFRVRQCADDLDADIELRFEKTKLSVIISGPDEVTKDLLSKCKKLKGIDVRKPTSKESKWREMFSSAIEIWPKELGDPEAMLGLGESDPLEIITESFVPLTLGRAKRKK